MSSLRRYRWFGVLSLGMVAGLALGIGATLGILRSPTRSPEALAQAKFDELKLHASASMGSETFAIATGMIDEDGEGVFFLDYLTGDLNCFVMNPRVGKFVGWFQTNVMNDLPATKGKKPSYVLATGMWHAKGNGSVRPADTVVYVADGNSGAFAAYTFPWVRGTSSILAKQAAKMTLLDVGKARALELRE